MLGGNRDQAMLYVVMFGREVRRLKLAMPSTPAMAPLDNRATGAPSVAYIAPNTRPPGRAAKPTPAWYTPKLRPRRPDTPEAATNARSGDSVNTATTPNARNQTTPASGVAAVASPIQT